MSRITFNMGRAATDGCLAVVGAMLWLALFAPTPASAQMVLDPGQSHVITPAQTNCLQPIESVISSDTAIATAQADCDTATGEADVDTKVVGNGNSVEAIAASVFQFPFVIMDVGGGTGPSRVPIHVAASTEWATRLLNDHAFALQGHASMDILLQLREDPVPGGSRGRVIERTTILGATHGGISGCLSIPTDPAGAVSMAISCALTLAQRLRGSTLATLSAVVEVGKTYSIELQIVARASDIGTVGYVAESSSDVIAPQAPGLKWERMVINVGTDPNVVVADLQRQIDELREALEHHTHNFLTGKGAGHNDVLAVSSPAIIPGDSADGKTIEELQSGPVTGPPSEVPGKRRRLGFRR